jgi:hypothetical protein
LQCLTRLHDALGLLGQALGVLAVAVQCERLLTLAHAQHLLAKSAHALLQLGARTDLT